MFMFFLMAEELFLAYAIDGKTRIKRRNHGERREHGGRKQELSRFSLCSPWFEPLRGLAAMEQATLVYSAFCTGVNDKSW
jgi:hypothetical protein